MKLVIGAAVGAVLLAAMAGASYHARVSTMTLDESPEQTFNRLRGRFLASASAHGRFALSDLHQWRSDPVLVDSAGAYPQSQQYCDAEEYQELQDRGASKGLVWQRFRCDPDESLPEGFFARPPYLHLSGQSYVSLALGAQPEVFANREWLQSHTRYMHISELAEAADVGAELSPTEALAAGLRADTVSRVVAGEPMILAGEALLVRVAVDRQTAMAHYAVHARADWMRFLSTTPFVTVEASGETSATCLASLSNLCLRFDPARARTLTTRTWLLALGSASLLLLAGGVSLWRRGRARRAEQEARTFMLQTLTHELRTPTASAVLALETLRDSFDHLPAPGQEAFLRLCDDLGRLQRLIEASKQYLRGEGSDAAMRFRWVQVPSIRELVLDLLERYGDRVHLQGPEQDSAAQVDPYWFGVCLHNLVDNALRHGAAPVTVVLDSSGPRLRVAVQDGGPGSPLQFQEMLQAFQRGPKSQGLGLGLSVVHRIAREMGGELTYRTAPTRFALSLPRQR